MTDAAHETRLLLRDWVREVRDPDPQQREWKLAYATGMLEAAERAAPLPKSELDIWRTVMDDGELVLVPPTVYAKAGDAHLEELLSRVTPMRREADDAGHAARQRFHHGLEALHGAGILDDHSHDHWRSRALAAEAPWLGSEGIAEIVETSDGFFAVGIPAESAEQEEQDRVERERWQRLSRRGALGRVLVAPTVERIDGLALLALVLRSESIELLFHHVGPPQGQGPDEQGYFERFTVVTDALRPPGLKDDLGTVYEALSNRPGSSHGTGGRPDPERPMVVTGSWRYARPAARAATRFFASLGSMTQEFHAD